MAVPDFGTKWYAPRSVDGKIIRILHCRMRFKLHGYSHSKITPEVVEGEVPAIVTFPFEDALKPSMGPLPFRNIKR